MANPNPQSLWTYDLLWKKAQAYIDRAMSVPRDDDLFPFWSSLALEFLARSALAFVSPVLLADSSDSDGRNLLHALGLEPKVKNFVPKSLQTNEVLSRCEQIIPNFTNDLYVFCRGLTNRRNEELHSGGLPFSKLQNDTWLPRYYEVANVLLKFQKKELSDLIGKAEAKAAQAMLNAVADEAAKSVQKMINAHAEVWKGKEQDEKDQLTLTATASANPSLGHVIDCPACKSKALLHGEEIRKQPPSLEGDELIVRRFMLPIELSCKACGLVIKGHNRLYAAGLGSQYTSTTTFDPLDYYADLTLAEDSSFEYNNE